MRAVLTNVQSGWDIPLASTTSSKRLTTGFSDTNDGKRMLPMTIQQHDLQGLAHTNAEVLTYLLRNQRYILAADNFGRHISEIALLHKIHAAKGPKIRVLIDAGAQILEMSNIDLVRAWLDIDLEAQAAIYFNESSKPMVIYRNNYARQTPLIATPFADDLSGCLVYMDEAHTRGTDLKMPADARGALTLGIGQTKDHTVQGPCTPSLSYAPRVFGTMILPTSFFQESLASKSGKLSVSESFTNL